jgi:hypothetical protein
MTPPANVITLHPGAVKRYLATVNDLATSLPHRTVSGDEGISIALKASGCGFNSGMGGARLCRIAEGHQCGNKDRRRPLFQSKARIARFVIKTSIGPRGNANCNSFAINKKQAGRPEGRPLIAAEWTCWQPQTHQGELKIAGSLSGATPKATDNKAKPIKMSTIHKGKEASVGFFRLRMAEGSVPASPAVSPWPIPCWARCSPRNRQAMLVS